MTHPKKHQKNENDDNETKSFVLSASDLSGTERVVAFLLFQAKARSDPLASRTVNMPFEHISTLMQMMTARLELHLTKIEGSLNRLGVQLERDRLYEKLLCGGVPARFLTRHFAKSRRDIEGDRQRAGLAAKHKGRPPQIDLGKQFEIAGHWSQLEEEERDPAKRLSQLQDIYPEESMASICRLIEEIES